MDYTIIPPTWGVVDFRKMRKMRQEKRLRRPVCCACQRSSRAGGDLQAECRAADGSEHGREVSADVQAHPSRRRGQRRESGNDVPDEQHEVGGEHGLRTVQPQVPLRMEQGVLPPRRNRAFCGVDGSGHRGDLAHIWDGITPASTATALHSAVFGGLLSRRS